MRNLARIFFLLSCICFCTATLAQDAEKLDVTGVWTGEIFNDSTQKYIPFELAISQKNGVFSGYSYTVFVIDSIENIGVKEVTLSQKNGIYIVKDKKLIDDNYSDRPAKGVYTTFEMSHSQNDTADILAGRWFTNKTKQFYPLSGTVHLSKKRRFKETRIVRRLSELGLANSLSFVTPSHGNDIAVNQKPPQRKPDDEPMMTIIEPELVVEIPKKDSAKNIRVPDAKDVAAILAEVGRDKEATAPDGKPQGSPTQKNLPQATPASTSTAGNKSTSPESANPTVATNSSAAASRSVATEDAVVAEKVQAVSPLITQIQSEKKAADAVVKAPLPEPRDISKRKIETIQSVPVLNDSIILTLYDNGTIDGDTVSVLLNGKTIVSRVGLLATAFNHTVHLTPEMGDSIKIILYAENLGSIPPNTGLLVIRDGDRNHEIRFSGDLKNNSAIILLRNKRE